MIINTNMSAMNTLRQLSINEKATAGSLAKLSSGLRINSAADDAAGLAISEKMRGQISGLNKASSNAQDGISMVSTAEGSLNETTSILQRMRELAVQAGNDTNTATDRTAMQNEMNQLTSEVNRIGNTTEFNTQKLLNGGTQISANASASGTNLTGGLSVGNSNATVAAGGATVTGTDQEAAVWDSGALTAVTTGQARTVTFNGTTVTINGLDDATAGDQTSVGAASGTAVAIALDTDATGANLNTEQVVHIVSAFNAMKTAGGAGGALANFTFAVDSTGTGIKVTDTLADGADNNLLAVAGTATLGNVGAAAQFAGTDGNTGVDGVAAGGNITFSAVAAEGTSITVADNKISFYDSSSQNFADAAAAKTALSADFVVDTNGITTAAGMAAAVVAAVNSSPISGWTVSVNGGASDQIDILATSTGVTTLTSAEIADKTDIAVAVAASGDVTFTGVPTEDSKVTIGTSSFGFYDSTSGKYADAAAAKTALGTSFVIDTDGKTTVDSIKNAVLAYAPQMTDVTLADGGVGKIDVTAATAGAAGNTIDLDAPEATTSGFTATLQIGANTDQTMVVQVGDMRSQALNLSSNTGGTITAANGSVATLTTTLTASNGSNNINTEYTLDISSAAKATAAISVIDDATSRVSAERSILGAVQNRLEHTINNLGTSSQNITAAEANIRDVDMAKEMAAFQKNNVLQQAAQAMLAQANQQPSQVLQLLR